MINDRSNLIKKNPIRLIFINISGIAIITGGLIGFGFSFLLNLLGLALELKLFSTTNTGVTVIALSGMISILVGLIGTQFAAGYITGYLGRLDDPQWKLGIIYGLTTWSLILLLNVLLMTPLNQYLFNLTDFSPPENLFSTSPGLNLEIEPQKVFNLNTLMNNSPSDFSIHTSPKVISESAFIIFILFFISLFSSCLGSCWAMSAKREKADKPKISLSSE